MRRTWPRLGGQLGFLCIAIGLVAIVLGWNGAAGEFEVDAQIPYLLSGGAAGLALVGVGAALLVVQNSRRDRAILEAQLDALSTSVTRLANAVAEANAAGPAGDASPLVVAGGDSYHRLDCRLVEGRDLPRLSARAAAAEGLEPCRICKA